MTVFSFARSDRLLRLIEVEVALIPGLPAIHFLGLPDLTIRESVLRIKAALSAQNFDFPKTRQVVVNLKPSHVKKTSRGVELAVATAILWETEQIPKYRGPSPIIYGELSLDGKIKCPEDLAEIEIATCERRSLLTGAIDHSQIGVPVVSLNKLSDLHHLTEAPPLTPAPTDRLARPSYNSPIRVGLEQAKILAVAAIGEHHTLFAGPQGSGKSTAAQWIYHLLRDPEVSRFQESRRIWRSNQDNLTWRPLVSPHHTTTRLGLIGGGSGAELSFGEITRAHGGVLLMDEYLEYDSKVHEALREPLENGEVRLARVNARQTFPADFLLMATTNLCPCGQYVPGQRTMCQCRPSRIRRYLERLSGPMLDRISMLIFSRTWAKDGIVSFQELQERVFESIEFSRAHRGQHLPNQKMNFKELGGEEVLRKWSSILPTLNSGSHRRVSNLLKVARSVADFEKKQDIDIHHLNCAAEWCILGSQRLMTDFLIH